MRKISKPVIVKVDEVVLNELREKYNIFKYIDNNSALVRTILDLVLNNPQVFCSKQERKWW